MLMPRPTEGACSSRVLTTTDDLPFTARRFRRGGDEIVIAIEDHREFRFAFVRVW
jgi:hypothetical protein